MSEDSQAVQIAVLQTQVTNLSTDIADLKTEVKNLTAVMNRGKGAFAASLALAGAIGAFIMKVITYLLNAGQHGGT